MKIVYALSIDGTSHVVEIGPGTGILTEYLLERHPKFLAMDVDAESVYYLKDNYPMHEKKFQNRDYLKYELTDAPVSIIGNFPYNISSQIFFKIWEDRSKVSEVVCMIQKEVADRICAPHGSKTYGILSVLLQAFYDIEFLFTVPPSVFHPPPKVQSAVIRLIRNNRDKLKCDEELFKKVVKAGFGQRRKTLRNALKGLNLSGGMEDEMLGLRAEQLSTEDFIQLTTKLSP